MRRDGKGQALLFDALLFLAASSLVSVSMVGALSGDSQRASDELQDYVDRAHSVFLRATIELPSIQGNQGNKSVTVGQAVLVLLSNRDGGGAFRAQAEEGMSRVLSGLLAPRFDFRWTANGSGSSIVIECGTAPPEGPRGDDTFVSTIDALEAGDAGVAFELRAWYSAE